jgi:hypothetical protein
MDKESEEYKKAKHIADKKYKKPSAYKSGYISKLYKQFGGKYKSTKKRGLKTWFNKEKWIDIEQFIIHNKIKPCGYSKIPLCRPLHGKYGIGYYNLDKIKKSLDELKQKKSKQQTINWNVYKK